MDPIQKLREERAALIASATALQDAADQAGRDMTDEEITQHSAHLDKAESMQADITRRERAAKAEAGLGETAGRRAAPNAIAATAAAAAIATAGLAVNVRAMADDDPCRGYASHTAFLADVMAVGQGRQPSDLLEPLRVMDTAGTDEQQGGNNTFGGFAVPEGFSPTLLQVKPEDAGLQLGTTRLPMTSPIVRIPARVDKDHSTSVSGGFTVSRRLETKAGTVSRMSLEQVTLHAYSLFGGAYASEELLTDSPISFAALIAAGFKDEFHSHMLEEYLNGTGVGEYLGVNNSPCLVSIAKEGSQTADTIVYANLIKARARCFGYAKAIWLANPDTIPTLSVVKNPAGGTERGIFHPSTGDDIPDRLLGRPIIFTDACETVGDAGDIVLGNWSQYLEGTLEGMSNAASVHVRFLEHERTFKFWLRNAGAPWWKSALTPKKGSNTRSPFVRIAVRG